MQGITFLYTIILALFALITIFGFTNLNTGSNLSNNQNNIRMTLQDENISNENFKISKHQMTKPLFSNWVVKGQVVNGKSSQIRHSIIKVNFFDKNENILYSGSTNLNNVAPGETRDFEVKYQGSTTPDSYKLEIESSI